MNISGTVRVDLSGYVEFGHLQVTDAVVRQVWPLLGGGDGPFLLDIGRADWVTWDERLVELLLAADGLEVQGTSEAGVRQATLRLRQASDARVPGPRSAS